MGEVNVEEESFGSSVTHMWFESSIVFDYTLYLEEVVIMEDDASSINSIMGYMSIIAH